MAPNRTVCFWLCLLGLLLPLALPARNVDLATVPERRTVQLTIYNSEDLKFIIKSCLCFVRWFGWEIPGNDSRSFPKKHNVRWVMRSCWPSSTEPPTT